MFIVNFGQTLNLVEYFTKESLSFISERVYFDYFDYFDNGESIKITILFIILFLLIQLKNSPLANDNCSIVYV
jgi:hypothetical protein